VSNTRREAESTTAVRGANWRRDPAQCRRGHSPRATRHPPPATSHSFWPIREFEHRAADQQPNTKSIDRTNW